MSFRISPLCNPRAELVLDTAEKITREYGRHQVGWQALVAAIAREKSAFPDFLLGHIGGDPAQLVKIETRALEHLTYKNITKLPIHATPEVDLIVHHAIAHAVRLCDEDKVDVRIFPENLLVGCLLADQEARNFLWGVGIHLEDAKFAALLKKHDVGFRRVGEMYYLSPSDQGAVPEKCDRQKYAQVVTAFMEWRATKLGGPMPLITFEY